MSTITRKQRQWQDREARIREVSRTMLLREGYHGLNMDRIAQQLEYSKGTIYNHFSCKEEIIIALAIETTEIRTGLFERGAAFRGRPRDRMLAIGIAAELFVRLYPDHFRVEQIIRSDSIWEKTSEARRSLMRSCENRCMGMVSGVVRDAVAQGDLQLPPEITPEDLVFGLWSLSFGAYSLIATSRSLAELGVRDGFLAVREHMQRVLDGYRWQPLSTEDDRKQVQGRIEREVYPDEFKRVAASVSSMASVQ